jgi:hypothetical protein
MCSDRQFCHDVGMAKSSSDAIPLFVDDEARDGEYFDGPDGRELFVPYEWADSVAEQVASGDVRAAGLVLHAVAEALLSVGPNPKREMIERRAARVVRRRVVLWHVTSPETFSRLGVAPRQPVDAGVVRSARGRRLRRRAVRVAGVRRRSRAPARPDRPGEEDPVPPSVRRTARSRRGSERS